MNAFFVFSGQGAQAAGMGKDLAATSAAAAAIFAKADAALDWSVSELCFNGPEEKLTESRYCQPAIYTMSCAALEAFRQRCPDISPCGCAGLSLGEYAALFAAAAFKFEDGLRLVSRRAELMDAACRDADGAMAGVLGGDVKAVANVCRDAGIDIANYNSPGQVVISGERQKVEKAVEVLKELGMRKIIPLKVAGAYHSRLMAEAGKKFRRVLDEAVIDDPAIPVCQNYTGAAAVSAAAVRDNLEAQVAGSVRWEQCVRALVAAGGDTMIEFGPGNVLTGLLRRTLPEIAAVNINSAETLAAFRPN